MNPQEFRRVKIQFKNITPSNIQLFQQTNTRHLAFGKSNSLNSSICLQNQSNKFQRKFAEKSVNLHFNLIFLKDCSLEFPK
jgi:hypothetical protein